jgi:autophagy-related protein 9
MSYPFATRYMDQFPKDKTNQIMRFIALVAGALTAVLALATVIDPEIFLGFELSPDRTVLFYLGLFGSVFAVARNNVPEENMVFEPEYALNNVIDYIHYRPAHWENKLHSDEVRKEFSMLYQLKIVLFFQEMLSVIFTPFVLWFSLPDCSERIVDFFREFTVHVDGLGYVCSFAVFDFKTGANNTARRKSQGRGDSQGLRDDYYADQDGKMLQSYYNFVDNYGPNSRGNQVPAMSSQHRRQFHPPPAFPGLQSPVMAGNRGPVGGHPQQRTPRFPLAGSQHHASPMVSMLLDPIHQPSASSVRPRQSVAHSQYRPAKSRFHPETPIEDDEELPQEATLDRNGSGLSTGDELGGSFMTTRAAAVEESEENVSNINGGDGAGVLGLLYGFQKTQTEPRMNF